MKRLFPALLLLLPMAGCSGGDPEPVVGDNPAAKNGRTGDSLTPEQKSKRQNAAQPPSGPG